MTFIKSSALVFLSSILFLLAILLILGGLMVQYQQFTAWVIHAITNIGTPIPLIAGGVIILLGSFVVYALAGRAPNSSATFTFEGEKGPINISLRAIEDYITKHFDGKNLVGNIRTRVGTSKDRKRLRVRANISVWSEQNLKDAGDNVQREIASRLKDGLGLDNVDGIIVSVDKIIPSRSPKSVPPKVSDDEFS